MNEEIFDVTAAALLHDLGKVIHRTGNIDSRAHTKSGHDFLKEFTNNNSILDSVRYHHKANLLGSDINEDSKAYIIYIADNIAAGADRRGIEGDDEKTYKFDKEIPLSPVFNILNNNSGNYQYPLINLHKIADKNDEIVYPVEDQNIRIINSEYNRLLQDYKEGLAGMVFTSDYINSFLELNEALLSYVPSSTAINQLSDISLHDHQKITAAIASSIYLYLEESKRNNYKYELLDEEKVFLDEKAFLLYSCDISGIQKFIYTIANKNALKALRARSFYLDFMLEHILDEILAKLNLSRANLIYSGGGHAYMLLPNTSIVKKVIFETEKDVNEWLMKAFKTTLFIAMDYQECSGNELMNIPYEDEPYGKIFKEVSAKLAKSKLRRYTIEQLKEINSQDVDGKSDRECQVCGTEDELSKDRDICTRCENLEEISSAIIKEEMVLLVARKRLPEAASVELPGQVDRKAYLNILDKDTAKIYVEKEEDDFIRIYGKNKRLTGFKLATKLWLGDTYKQNKDGTVADFNTLAESSSGINRLAVLRADVDDLGSAFLSGFIRLNETDLEKKNRYNTLSRNATLSREMSLFFKNHINYIVKGKGVKSAKFRIGLDEEYNQGEQRAVTIVYSGGDDMFIVGAWDQIIELAIELRDAFEKFCAGALTFSAGISLFESGYPISRMAVETESLENAAKNVDGKNSVSLFGEELIKNNNGKYQVKAAHTYPWIEFQDGTLGEKLRLIQSNFKGEGDENKGGASLLYRLLDYIVDSEYSKINIARCAYLLGRMQPDIRADEATKSRYAEFSRKMYEWILDPNDRKQLVTAMNIFVYYYRSKDSK